MLNLAIIAAIASVIFTWLVLMENSMWSGAGAWIRGAWMIAGAWLVTGVLGAAWWLGGVI